MRLKKIVLATPLTFVKKKQNSPGIWSFSFKPDKPLEWQAGQHIVLFAKSLTGKRVRRAFSVSSAPSENFLTITTRVPEELSPFKQFLKKLKKGDKLSSRGPIGRLIIEPKSQNEYAFLASGIGITPFRSILKEMQDNNIENKITLFFANNKDSHLFKDELCKFNTKMKNLKIKYIYYPDRLLGSSIEEQLGEKLQSTIFFLSGSSQIIKSYRRTLTGLGIKRHNIITDTFIGLRTPQKLKILAK